MLIFIITLFITFLYLIFKTKNNLHMFQQNFYNENNRYMKWLVKNKKVFKEDILFILIIILGLFIKDSILGILLIISIIF